ncbi:dicarboxylate/amino acid:cation symporter [Novosphingobium aerophilum]|uniref:dicarboxylate/amino acid:cation symporter n=1 Tax=Novosphingobium TaxID=165696 RepID=UPI0006C872DD|nr:dicarboxylate/amino acid:cation symporter [Novosphingobium sp. ST904]KPH61822.1 sodium:proton antiporter [Novosphingobium sp. ST904]TCM34380.1 Na+/H+-dicarboxylate symporter [Novosphingobium sp. ST904]
MAKTPETSASRHPGVPSSGSRWPGFGVQVLLGMVVGLAAGLLVRQLGPDSALASGASETFHTVAQIFIQLLRTLVPPLVFTAIIASVAALRGLDNAVKLVGQTLLWFAITALIAVLIGIALGLTIQPGLHAHVDAGAAHAPASVGGWLDFLKGLVPANYLGITAATTLEDGAATTAVSFNVLQIIIAAVAVGAAAVKIGAKAEPFLAFMTSANLVLRQLLRWLIALTPLGSAALIANAVVSYGWDALSALGAFAGAVYIGLAVVMLAVYPLLLLLHGINPLRFFSVAWPAIQIGFLSRSSVGTMPVTEEVTERLGVPRSYAAFAVPLGSTTKMDGCAAIYPAISAIFVAQFYGVPLQLSDYALIVFVSVIGSAATAGLTGAVVMLTLTLSTLKLPLEGVGLLLAIDPILDMGRTAVNVAGQALVPTIVAQRLGIRGPMQTGDIEAPRASAA